MMRHIGSSLICVMLTIILSGWAWAEGPARKGYKNMEVTPHMRIYWNCGQADGDAMGIEGLVEVKGQSESAVYGLQLRLIGFDRAGEAISQKPLMIGRYKLQESMPYHFTISLPLQGGETEFGLWVYYRYIPSWPGGGKKVSRISYSSETYSWTFRDICPKE